MSKRKSENGGEIPLRKSARLQERSHLPPSSAPFYNRNVGEQQARILLSPPTSSSNRDNHYHNRLLRSETDRSKVNNTFKRDSRGTQSQPSISARRRRKHEEEQTQASEEPRRKKAPEKTAEPREQAAEAERNEGVSRSSDKSVKDLGISEQNEEGKQLDAIGHWAAHCTWPEDFSSSVPPAYPKAFGMAGLAMSQENSSKRRSESTHRSSKIERMAENGVFMKSSAQLQKSSKDLCNNLLEGNHTPLRFPCFPEEKIPDILERIDHLNEGRIQRDVTPWVVPSAENLYFCGESHLDYIGDEVQAEWTRCATMGSTRPKPDFTAGLLRKAFTKDELQKLRNYASPEWPFFFTPELCFPFLICEAKNGDEGLNKADRQNIHSASIAVRALIKLYWAAFGKTSARVQELYGKVLAFTISHNGTLVNLYGHYALAADGSVGELEFYRYDMAVFSLRMRDGADRYKPYNFVRNVYDKFAPEHLRRIKDAATLLPAPGQATGLSFTTSGLDIESEAQADSQEASFNDEAGFRKPALPVSALSAKIEEQRKQMEEQQKQIEEQMEEKRKTEEMIRRDTEEQRKLVEEQQKQIEELRKEIISLVKKPQE